MFRNLFNIKQCPDGDNGALSRAGADAAQQARQAAADTDAQNRDAANRRAADSARPSLEPGADTFQNAKQQFSQDDQDKLDDILKELQDQNRGKQNSGIEIQAEESCGWVGAMKALLAGDFNVIQGGRTVGHGAFLTIDKLMQAASGGQKDFFTTQEKANAKLEEGTEKMKEAPAAITKKVQEVFQKLFGHKEQGVEDSREVHAERDPDAAQTSRSNAHESNSHVEQTQAATEPARAPAEDNSSDVDSNRRPTV